MCEPDPVTPAPDGGAWGDLLDDLEQLLQRECCADSRLFVAFSGGPDSTVLLALAAARGPRRRLRAIHVDHGWHADAPAWGEHCRQAARRLGVACDVVRVDSRPRGGEGAEAAARTARYEALSAALAPGDILLTGHHADDQAETVLFGLLRGGGVRALAGMPTARALGHGRHLRPLLGRSRACIRQVLEQRGLPALDDPANRDVDHDRVFLREQVLPLLRQRWPAVDRGLVRNGELAADAMVIEDALAAIDYTRCQARLPATLDCAALLRLPAARQRALVRWWLRREGLPVPPAARLASALAQIATARTGRNPCIAWPGGELRRWRGRVWALAPRPEPVPGAVFHWPDMRQPLDLPERRLPAELLADVVADPDTARVTLERRQRGERVQVKGESRPRALSELLRDIDVPPWERPDTLLVRHAGRLIAVIAGDRVIPVEGD